MRGLPFDAVAKDVVRIIFKLLQFNITLINYWEF